MNNLLKYDILQKECLLFIQFDEIKGEFSNGEFFTFVFCREVCLFSIKYYFVNSSLINLSFKIFKIPVNKILFQKSHDGD